MNNTSNPMVPDGLDSAGRAAVRANHMPPWEIEQQEPPRRHSSTLLVVLPLLAGMLLLAKPVLFAGLHLNDVLCLLGGVACFVVAATWLTTLRETPCMAAL